MVDRITVAQAAASANRLGILNHTVEEATRNAPDD
jgi:hypothetical protein